MNKKIPLIAGYFYYLKNSKFHLQIPISNLQIPISLIQTVVEVFDSPDVGNHLDVFEFLDIDAHFALLIQWSKFLFHS
jgi:hypothetical protein